MEIPMLEEHEWAELLPYLQQGSGGAQEVRARYKQITGFDEPNPIAIWHHRFSLFGPPCEVCGKPLRTPRAKLCAECGNSRNEPHMQDYYHVVANAVLKLDHDTEAGRARIYDNARITFTALLKGQKPPLSEADIDRHQLALESAIRRVELEASSNTNQTPERSRTVQLPPPNQPTAPTAIPKKDKIVSSKKRVTTSTQYFSKAITSTGGVLFGIALFVGMTLAAALYIRGIVWVSEHVIEYLMPLIAITIILCLFILLPLGIFRKTRPVSAIGFIVASYLFGVTTWILGLLTTLQYWGGIGVAIGMFLGIVGIVPLGIIASAFNYDWWSVGGLITGLFITYGSRALGLGLEAKC